MVLNKSNPIGIFDSGSGGLTITKAIVEKLPHESIVYFGDAAHFPYGEKSVTTLQEYSRKITEFLLQQNCKLILIACGTASSTAFNFLQEKFADKATIMNVIDPMIEYVAQNYANQNIGLIATRRTVNSNVYQQKIAALHENIHLKALATPLLIAAIEEGFIEHKVTDCILEEYLSRPEMHNIKALILGCTHYPIIKTNLAKIYRQLYQHDIDLLDASEIVASAVATKLKAQNLLCDNNCQAKKSFYVSELTEGLTATANMFFGEDVKLQLKQL